MNVNLTKKDISIIQVALMDMKERPLLTNKTVNEISVLIERMEIAFDLIKIAKGA